MHYQGIHQSFSGGIIIAQNGLTKTGNVAEWGGILLHDTTIDTDGFDILIQGTGRINVAGLSASSAVYTDALQNLTTTIPTSGALGYWTRTGTDLYNTILTDNVGIGTATPAERLHVNGNMRIEPIASEYLNITAVGNEMQLNVPNSHVRMNTGGNMYLQSGAGTVNIGLGGAFMGVFEPVPASALAVRGSLALGNNAAFSQVAAPTGGAIIEGNVGIGKTTVTAGAKMDINGNIYFSNAAPVLDFFSGVPGSYSLDRTGTTITLKSGSALDLNGVTWVRMITGGSERMRINNVGNVGIAQTTPSEKLHVTGNFRLDNAFMPGNDAGVVGEILTSQGVGVSPTWEDPSVLLAGDFWSTAGNAIVGTEILGTTNAQPLHIYTNNTEKMTILSNGNVGIGITAPTSALHVVGDIRATNQGIFNSVASSLYQIDANNQLVLSGINTILKTQGSIYMAIDSDNNDADTRNFIWQKNSGTPGGGVELARITEGGQLLLGTTTSNGQLTIQSPAVNTRLEYVLLSNGDNALHLAETASGHTFISIGDETANQNGTYFSLNDFNQDIRLVTTGIATIGDVDLFSNETVLTVDDANQIVHVNSVNGGTLAIGTNIPYGALTIQSQAANDILETITLSGGNIAFYVQETAGGRALIAIGDNNELQNSTYITVDDQNLAINVTSHGIVALGDVSGLGFGTVMNISDPNNRITTTGKFGVNQPTPTANLDVGGSVAMRTTTTSVNISLGDANYSVFVDTTSANRTVSLPDAVPREGRIYVIKRVSAGANTLTVNCAGGQTIDGAATLSIPTQYMVRTVQAVAGNWYIIGN